jgi:RNA polymerase sigma-70 factor (ECF subfamily)
VPAFSGTFPGARAITTDMREVAPSDRDLVRRTAAGDRDAFGELYRRHHGLVYRFARLMTGSTTIAEDIVQDVFLDLMRDPLRYDSERAALPTYLFGAARHCTRRRLARDARLVTLDAAGVDTGHVCPEDVSGRLVREDELQRLRRSILSLPSRYREAIVLCDLQDVSYADAAATIGCAVGTIRSRLHRARNLLGQKMRAAALRCAV